MLFWQRIERFLFVCSKHSQTSIWSSNQANQWKQRHFCHVSVWTLWMCQARATVSKIFWREEKRTLALYFVASNANVRRTPNGHWLIIARPYWHHSFILRYRFLAVAVVNSDRQKNGVQQIWNEKTAHALHQSHSNTNRSSSANNYDSGESWVCVSDGIFDVNRQIGFLF